MRLRALRRSSQRREAGLTLIEVMVALAILAGGLLAMLAMQISAMRGGRVGRDYTEAARIAQDRMEFFHRLAWADPQIQPTAWTLPVVVNGSLSGAGPGATPQSFNMQWRIVANADPNLRQIDVRVTWLDPGAAPGAVPRRYAVSSVRHNDP